MIKTKRVCEICNSDKLVYDKLTGTYFCKNCKSLPPIIDEEDQMRTTDGVGYKQKCPRCGKFFEPQNAGKIYCSECD